MDEGSVAKGVRAIDSRRVGGDLDSREGWNSNPLGSLILGLDHEQKLPGSNVVVRYRLKLYVHSMYS